MDVKNFSAQIQETRLSKGTLKAILADSERRKEAKIYFVDNFDLLTRAEQKLFISVGPLQMVTACFDGKEYDVATAALLKKRVTNKRKKLS